MNKLLEDPALIVGLIRAGLILAVSFGVGITQAQQDSLLIFVGALLAVMSVALSAVTVKLTTSVAKPTLPEGTRVEVTTPPNQEDYHIVT